MRRPERVELVEPDAVIDDEGGGSAETSLIFRVLCPDCVQPIALLEGEDVLPEHARVTPANPFGLTVCGGSGSPLSAAAPQDARLDAHAEDSAALLTLPEGLDWRRQPFSHVGGPGNAPVRRRLPGMRRRK
ncbi:hypothetical protein [Streptomyces sp. MAR4 CNX-425]|uniref:hypothetical protein n=1 Tax=Streptomyces sp. MAR4 CNX-425 TaxID=3406343 RepID=UPI003B514E7A